MKEFLYGMLAGAGALALAQNLFDYRIDEVFLEYVVAPVKAFFGGIASVFKKKA